MLYLSPIPLIFKVSTGKK